MNNTNYQDLKKGVDLAHFFIKEKYLPTIGLEIHAELKTKTKMFCACINNPDEIEPNKNICPICMGHPGTLPVLNLQAIKNVLKVGYSINSKIADYTEWDRKNYFYPDIPKGYQISQYKYPLITGGEINGIELTRIHLEEDTASSSHDKGDFSLVNYNRAGVPLMELVTEPVIHSAKQAGDFARELQLLLQYLDVSLANMEKGEMRVEANISVALIGDEKLGTKVEVKNLNSFKSVEKAIEYEINRMIDLIESNKKDEIVQETRGWDEINLKTFSQRKKETSGDYRYFPDPDLPKMRISEISEFSKEKILLEIPMLPWEKRENYRKLGLNEKQVEFFVNNFNFSEFFDQVILDEIDSEKIKLSANYISSDLVSLFNENRDLAFKNINSVGFKNLIQMIIDGKLSSRGAKDTLSIYVKNGGDVFKIAESNNLIQKNDLDLVQKIADQIIAENSDQVSEYRSGKEATFQFLLGQGMKISKGSVNPQILTQILKEKLSK
jgi:aspartyl-tRNA(Asn)/glutamyl-tRNA(Gln) amidotransferase subunit B